MKEWFGSLAPRERLVVAFGGAVAVLLLVHVALVEPMLGAYEQRTSRVASLERDLAWMTSAAAEVRTLHARGRGSGGASTDRPAYLAVDEAVRGGGLPRPERLEPAGSAGVRVEFSEVAFDALIGVLGRLERDARLQVTRARFSRVDDGVVSAQLTLERDPS